MSLRLRLSLSIVAALLVSLVVAAALACWHAASGVRTELTAAMDVGSRTVQDAADTLPGAGGPGAADATADLSRLIAAFDGDRHVRATRVAASGAALCVSHPLRPDPGVPRWFVSLVAPSLPDQRIALPASAGGGAVVLHPEPANEASEKWSGLGDSAVDLALFCALACGLMLITVGRGLRPLDQLAAALDRVGPGNYGVRVPAAGPPDVARLAAGFNRMEERLAAVEVQNRRLTEQLLTLQDEERADLARDLHDEVGPFLFSITIGAAAIERLAAAGEPDAIPAQAALIRDDALHIQKHVKGILARLRPVAPSALGLAAAVEDMLAFWRARSPEIAFHVAIGAEAEDADEAHREVAYRVIQEAVSNAVRHSNPRRIALSVQVSGGELAVRIHDDGTPLAPSLGAGFGLDGMRERLATLGGRLEAGPRTDQPGWEVAALLPRQPVTEPVP